MSDTQTYITAHCCIAQKRVYRNGMLLLNDETSSDATGFLLSAYKYFNVDYPKFYKMDNLCKLGFLAAEILLKGRRIAEEYTSETVGIVLSNANSSLDADLNYFQTVKNIPSPAQFVYTLPNIVIGEISIRHHCKGENAFFVSDSFDADFMQFYVQDLMDRKRINACISGWVDCLGEDYQAAVYLAENRPGNDALPFDRDHIHQIYEIANGEING